MLGGDEENRTPDPLLARQVLSQLSYTPKCYTTFRCYLVSSGLRPALHFRFLARSRDFYFVKTLSLTALAMFRICIANASGGPKWTRTTDLTLIRRAL